MRDYYDTTLKTFVGEDIKSDDLNSFNLSQ